MNAQLNNKSERTIKSTLGLLLKSRRVWLSLIFVVGYTVTAFGGKYGITPTEVENIMKVASVLVTMLIGGFSIEDAIREYGKARAATPDVPSVIRDYLENPVVLEETPVQPDLSVDIDTELNG